MLSPAKMEFIERLVVFHMGVIVQEFHSGTLDENLCENINKIHFMANMDNKMTLKF